MAVRELKRLYELSFRHLLGGAFDHDHIVFRADVNNIEIALGALAVRRVGHKLAVHAADTDSANWPGERNVRNAQRSRCAVHRENVGIIFTVGAKQDRDDLRVVKISLRKEWPQRPIDHARSERFFFRRTAFTLEIAARKFSCRCRFFAIIDREREIILTFFDCCG